MECNLNGDIDRQPLMDHDIGHPLPSVKSLSVYVASFPSYMASTPFAKSSHFMQNPHVFAQLNSMLSWL
jgi:hypothetical protein